MLISSQHEQYIHLIKLITIYRDWYFTIKEIIVPKIRDKYFQFASFQFGIIFITFTKSKT